MIKLTIQKAQKILMAYKGQSVSIEDCQNVFVNHNGKVVFLYNEFNFKYIGLLISETEFYTKGVKFQL